MGHQQASLSVASREERAVAVAVRETREIRETRVVRVVQQIRQRIIVPR